MSIWILIFHFMLSGEKLQETWAVYRTPDGCLEVIKNAVSKPDAFSCEEWPVRD